MKISNITFGEYVKKLRLKSKIGLRELARKLEISATYLNDIEKQKRSAPKSETVSKIAKLLSADTELVLDLASKSRKDIAADLQKMISKSPETVKLLRAINGSSPTEKKIKEMRGYLMTINYKVIIIAAGLGSRLKEYTENLPKCLLKFGKKSLLQHQIDSYADVGISNFSLVRGYKKECFNLDNIKYYDNDEYKDNNILNSLFYAEKEISGNVIISYSDILFESSIVQRLLESNHDISIVVDIDWRGYYVNRNDHPIDEAENVIFDANNDVIKIGKIMTDKDDVHGEFIGMLKLSPRGAEIFKQHFNRSKKLYWDKPFQRAQTFQKAYITDLLQEMADLGVSIHCVIIERGWKEIDTIEDFEKALVEFSE
ncbi:NTP transferase domain-containing protein [Pelagibacteraceae bacterium]|jgi:choline kinase/DNA-binding XRE family transcriptional regulator|nr:NTP transferase domain-containing protein [Pelagibacteraceae bacterium]